MDSGTSRADRPADNCYAYFLFRPVSGAPEISMKRMLFALLLLPLAACSPEVGSDAWCADMKAKPKGEWTMDETGDYAKHCIFN